MTSAVKLTPAQWEMLDRVCRTNGGGVFAEFSETHRTTKLLRKLEAKGLVQGKSNRQSWAVHTPEGLALWRSKQAGIKP